MCVCARVCAYVYVCVRGRGHACIIISRPILFCTQVFIFVSAHTYVFVYVCIYKYVCMCPYVCTCVLVS